MGNDPKNPYFGRHFEAVNVDGGSFQCPEKTSAAAKTIANDIRPFVVFNNFDGAQYNMAAGLNGAAPRDRRPMHFGTLWLSDNDYGRCEAGYKNCTGFAPYVWTQFATGTTIVNQYAGYVCSRLVGGKANRSPNAAIAARQARVRLRAPQRQQDARSEAAGGRVQGRTTARLRRVTSSPARSSTPTDIAAAQTDASNMVVQLQSAGVTTVLMLADPVFPLFQLGEAKAQGYSPEWVWSSFGYTDSSTVQRLYDDDEVKGSFGISQLGVPGGFGYTGGDPFDAYHRLHQKSPRTGKPCDPSTEAGMSHDENYCKAPGAIVTWYYTLLPGGRGRSLRRP